MSTDFTEIMAQRTDKQLVEILNIKRDDYTAEAIEAAQIEFDKRSLTGKEVFDEEDLKRINEEEHESTAEGQKLVMAYKLLTFFSPAYGFYLIRIICGRVLEMPRLGIIAVPLIIIAHLFIYSRIKEGGFVTMAKDFKTWAKYSWMVFGTLYVANFIWSLKSAGVI